MGLTYTFWSTVTPCILTIDIFRFVSRCSASLRASKSFFSFSVSVFGLMVRTSWLWVLKGDIVCVGKRGIVCEECGGELETRYASEVDCNSEIAIRVGVAIQSEASSMVPFCDVDSSLCPNYCLASLCLLSFHPLNWTGSAPGVQGIDGSYLTSHAQDLAEAREGLSLWNSCGSVQALLR